MGQFTEGSIQIELKSEAIAIKVAEQIKTIEKYVTDKTGEYCNINVNSVDVSGTVIDVTTYSDRTANAEFGLEQIFEMCKDLFKNDMVQFTADIVVPECIISWSENDAEEDDE